MSYLMLTSLIVSVAQESRSSLAGLLWLGVSHKVAIRYWLGLQSSEDWALTGEPTLKMSVSHDSFRLVLAIDGRSLFLSVWASLQGCSMAWHGGCFPLVRTMGEGGGW